MQWPHLQVRVQLCPACVSLTAAKEPKTMRIVCVPSITKIWILDRKPNNRH